MKENNELDLFLESLERIELNEEQQILLSSFGGKNSSANNVTWGGCNTTNNCNSGNCVSGCGK